MRTLEDESRLTIEACHGSAAAFEALVLHYEPRIRRMLYSLTHDIQLTQDLCQETFLAAFRALPRMKGEELQFAPWIYRIALNQLRSEWRRRRRITWVPFTLPGGQNDDSSENQIEESLMSDERFEERIMERDLVARVLAQLPPASAACLLLDAEGFSYREIAEILQDSLSAVRSRLARSRQTFQQVYKRLDRGGQS
jgi:RNA polymerase sigma-70 factor (ECF subfamily)